MSDARITAEFIDGARGRILVVARLPGRAAGRSVLVVPPFAEEMNKSRAMIARLGSELATRGIATVLPDLHGTGDSDGELRDAHWGDWMRDIQAAARWSDENGWTVDAILGIRLGCALAADVTPNLSKAVSRALFWAPVHDGAVFLTQFLRLRAASTMMSDGHAETTASLRSRLADGETLEIAGYELNPTLASHLDRIRLPEMVGPSLGELTCIDVSRSDPPVPSEASRSAVGRFAARGVQVDATAVTGEPFWSATEVVINAELLKRSTQVLARPA